MHPARLRIHPGGGSRAPGSRPSRQPAPRLSGGPGGDTGGRAPCLARSFHFESTLRKFAKLVSRWLLLASREVPRINLRWRRLQVAPAGARLGGVGSEAGPARGGGCAPGTAWRAPRRSDPSGGCCLGGALARAPSARALPAPARPRPAPGPAAYCSARGGAGPEVRAGEIAMETRGRSGGGGGAGPTPLRPPHPPPCGAGPRGPGRERRGWAPGRPLPVGRWLCLSGPARPKAPASHPVERVRGDRRARRRAGWTREGRDGARCRAPACVTDGGGCWGAGGHTSPAKGRRLKRPPPMELLRDFEPQPATNCIQMPLGWKHF